MVRGAIAVPLRHVVVRFPSAPPAGFSGHLRGTSGLARVVSNEHYGVPVRCKQEGLLGDVEGRGTSPLRLQTEDRDGDAVSGLGLRLQHVSPVQAGERFLPAGLPPRPG